MIRFAVRLVGAISTIMLFACASNPLRGLDKVTNGMDKDQVLGLAGSPEHVYRANEADHWVYSYNVDGRDWKRDITFEKGHVSRILRRGVKEDWQKNLEQADSMEEFEKAARAHQEQKPKGKFESVDGGPSDAATPAK